jgi:AcrR family transcriptional regulator
MTELVAEAGYGAATIGALAGRAGVSRATFYELFADKEDCLLAAYDRFAEGLLTVLVEAMGTETAWERFVEDATVAYLNALEADLVAARAFMVELDGAGAAARERRRAAMHTFAGAFVARHAAARAADPSLGPIPERVFLGLTLGVRELIRERLEADSEPRLPELAADIRAWVGAMVAGA